MPARILAVHDRERSQTAFKTSLEPMHAVTVCNAVATVREKVAEFVATNADEAPFDLIVCDIHMNDVDCGNAIDFLIWTRTNVRLRDIPFLLLCTRQGLMIAQFVNGLRTASSELGAAGFLMADNIADSQFLRAVEEYLPGQLRSDSQVTAHAN